MSTGSLVPQGIRTDGGVSSAAIEIPREAPGPAAGVGCIRDSEQPCVGD